MRVKTRFNIYIIFYFLVGHSYSQTNLVPNGSFETYTACPTSLDQVNHCQGWSAYRNSPDYFNTCSSTSGITPPNCFAGYQQPQSGNAHAGFITYDNTFSNSNYREIIGAKLISSLNIGTKYYFSFFVSFGGDQAYEFATNKIGIRFSTVSASTLNPFPINNFAHYYCPTKITDSLNWTHLKGSFIADSVYDYIAFGNFFNDSNTDTLSTGPYNQNSYYYIDNICLSTDSNFAYNVSVNELDKFKNIFIYPNPSNGVLNIKCPDIPNEIELFDLIGKSQLKLDNLSSPNYVLNACFLNNGIYFLKIKIQDQIIQKQIIISKP